MRIFIGGPIAHWWGENWNTPQHREYVTWRDAVAAACAGEGHLVYRPDLAFKGDWDENDGDEAAQNVNDAALVYSHLMLDLRPDGVPSPGTDHERFYASQLEIPCWHVPPTPRVVCGTLELTGQLRAYAGELRRAG